MSKNNKEKDCYIQEKVVALIEQFLDEEATIKHNVQLPVLNSKSGATRQCDVVIFQGKKPRQTISIIEVQKRGSKVEINDFSGWLKKRDGVGAQHLICVSEKGFPKSIIEQAELEGPSVRLMTLKNLESDGWPLPSNMFNEELDITEYEKLNGITVEGHHLIKVKHMGQEHTDPHDARFRAPNSDLNMSATDVADWYLFKNPDQLINIPADGTSKLVEIYANWGMRVGLTYLDMGGTWVPLKSMRIQLRVSRHKGKLSWNASEYFQFDWGEGIAWAMRGDAEYKGKRVSVVVPIKTQGNGQYIHGHPHVIGDFDAFLIVGNQTYKAINFDDKVS